MSNLQSLCRASTPKVRVEKLQQIRREQAQTASLFLSETEKRVDFLAKKTWNRLQKCWKFWDVKSNAKCHRTISFINFIMWYIYLKFSCDTQSFEHFYVYYSVILFLVIRIEQSHDRWKWKQVTWFPRVNFMTSQNKKQTQCLYLLTHLI